MTLPQHHVSTYGAKRRKRSLTEAMILRDGFCGDYTISRSVAEIADRCEVSAHSLAPHLASLVKRGDIEEAGTGLYRRVVKLRVLTPDDELRPQALDLRCAGQTYDAIGRALGVSESHAHRLVNAA